MKKIVLLAAVACVIGILYFLLHPKPQQPLTVVGTTPAQNGTHSPFLPVIIQFNRTPSKNEYSVDITPKTDYALGSLPGTSVQINPTPRFLEETPYVITIKTKNGYVLTFTTAQAAGSIPGWNEDFDRSLDEAKKITGVQDDALYVIRKTAPILQDGFSITYSYSTDTYTVSLKQPYEQNKIRFTNWMNQNGVTNLSIVSITYVNQ